MFVALLCLVLLTSVSLGSAQDCLQNYADVETALIDDSENAYQIARAFFLPRAEGETLCVTVYYHVGLNSTEEEDKSNCPSVTIGSNQELTGCSKWKWCINTFYMDLNITQLQVFSFFIIFERTAEIDLRIPPFCVSEETMNEYLLRATNSLRLYAEGEGRLADGQPFLGYAARFVTSNELEPLIRDVNQNSLDVLFDSTRILNSEFNQVDDVFLFISLLSVPSFVAPMSGILFKDLQKKVREITEETGDFFPFILGLVVACVCGNITMLLFQMAAFNRGGPWYYVAPYCWLWVLIIIQFITSLFLIYKLMSRRERPRRQQHIYQNPFFWLQAFALWIVFMTVLLLSWHAVFIMLGFILNPFRALILTVIYAIGTICAVIMFTVVFSSCQLVYQYVRAKKTRVYLAAIYLLLMISILTFIISYISFMFRINVGSDNVLGSSSLIEWANSLLPPLFLVTLTWFLRKLLKLPNKLNKRKEVVESPKSHSDEERSEEERSEAVL